ncbi:MAG TPA: putative DNA-binding protein [Clostridiaceae bacterium]
MDERVLMSILLEYYGVLLTEKQNKVMDLYFNQDFSLAEIAEINETSRQAIFDTIKKCSLQLSNYEKKLELYKKNTLQELEKKNLLDLLYTLKETYSYQQIDILINNINNMS